MYFYSDEADAEFIKSCLGFDSDAYRKVISLAMTDSPEEVIEKISMMIHAKTGDQLHLGYIVFKNFLEDFARKAFIGGK